MKMNMNQLNETSLLQDDLNIQQNIDCLTTNMINKLRLDLKPDKDIVDSIRNLVILFQNTETWITIHNCETVLWSRLVQLLRQPKKLIFLLKSHSQYDLGENVYKIDYTTLQNQQINNVCRVINKIICSIVQFHNNMKEITLFSDEYQISSIRQLVPQVSKNSEYQDEVNTHSNRARDIMQMLQKQIENSKIGEYKQCFK